MFDHIRLALKWHDKKVCINTGVSHSYSYYFPIIRSVNVVGGVGFLRILNSKTR